MLKFENVQRKSQVTALTSGSGRSTLVYESALWLQWNLAIERES